MGSLKKFFRSKDSEPKVEQKVEPAIEIMKIGDEEYKTVDIGNQVWMAENLKIKHYRNGDPIPNVTSGSEWDKLSTGARCSYNNNENNAYTYGYLYNWFAITDNREIAPDGWHVPTDREWKYLEINLGMNQLKVDILGLRGTNEGSKLAGRIDLWDDGSLKGNTAFSESGFSGLPGGFRYPGGKFDRLGNRGYFWSASAYDTGLAWWRHLDFNRSDAVRGYFSKLSGLSVRLVRD